MPLGRGTVPILEVGTIVEAMRQHLGGTHDYALHCPRAAPPVGVVACTYHHWLRTFGQHRRYCQLPVSGRRMRQFLQFRLGSHQLPMVLKRFEVSMLPEPIGSALLVVVWLLQMSCT